MRLADDFQYEPEEEEQQQQTSKKERPKNLTKDELSKLDEWINKEETGINCKLFKNYFNFQRPSNTHKAVYTANDKKKEK